MNVCSIVETDSLKYFWNSDIFSKYCKYFVTELPDRKSYQISLASFLESGV